MEHLFFNPSQEELDLEAARIFQSAELNCEWNKVPGLTQNIAWDQYLWPACLSKKQRPESITSTSFWDYPKTCGVNFLESSSHAGIFMRKYLEEARYHLEPIHSTAILANWLVFGFLEALLNKRLHPNYLTREQGASNIVIDSRNLTFAFYAGSKRIS